MISNEIRGVDEGMLVTYLKLMLEVPGSPRGVVPREALEIVGVWAEVGVGAGAGTEEKKVAKRRMAKRRTSMPATETSAASDARCSRCGEAGQKTVRCPGQVCSVCGGKGHDASGSDSDGVLSGEEQDAFVCDAPGKFFYEPGKWGTNALA